MDGANSGAISTAGAGLSTPELEAQITELAGHLSAANRRWLALIAEFDRRKGWNDGLTQTCAHWLNWKCGIDIGAAREKVRVAHALEQLPAIGAAMARGELSYSKVRALGCRRRRRCRARRGSMPIAGSPTRTTRMDRS